MRKFAIFLLAISSFIALPACAESGWTVNVKIVKLVGTANGGLNVLMSPSLVSCVSQSGYGPNYASLYPTHPGKSQIAALLLAAYMSDKTIALYLTDKDCAIGEVALGGMWN